MCRRTGFVCTFMCLHISAVKRVSILCFAVSLVTTVLSVQIRRGCAKIYSHIIRVLYRKVFRSIAVLLLSRSQIYLHATRQLMEYDDVPNRNWRIFYVCFIIWPITAHCFLHCCRSWLCRMFALSTHQSTTIIIIPNLKPPPTATFNKCPNSNIFLANHSSLCVTQLGRITNTAKQTRIHEHTK